MEEQIQKYQKRFLSLAKKKSSKKPLSEEVQRAFIATPRHAYVPYYYTWEDKTRHEVTADNLDEHLAKLYEDRPVILKIEDNKVPSTVSQPSFVLQMLDMLQIEPGHKILELGAGSGWNAALMGSLVGAAGSVYSLEIIPEIAQMARESVHKQGLENVHIIEGDAGEGYAAGAPYDRATFTAGAFDLPCHFYDQIKEDGILLIIIKNEGGGDMLFLMRKREDHFESFDSMPCGFVPMTGKYEMADLKPIRLSDLENWNELKNHEVSRRPFWWGGKGEIGFQWRTTGIRSFLSIVEPMFQAFRPDSAGDLLTQGQFFGLRDEEGQSLVIAKDDALITYGNRAAGARMEEHIQNWVALGMPSSASFDLSIYPMGTNVVAQKNQWVVQRAESQFLWTLTVSPN
ncbi:MAG: protein-L-isoaspartate O-methyltransferase [Chloroflexota bacterium]